MRGDTDALGRRPSFYSSASPQILAATQRHRSGVTTSTPTARPPAAASHDVVATPGPAPGSLFRSVAHTLLATYWAVRAGHSARRSRRRRPQARAPPHGRANAVGLRVALPHGGDRSPDLVRGDRDALCGPPTAHRLHGHRRPRDMPTCLDALGPGQWRSAPLRRPGTFYARHAVAGTWPDGSRRYAPPSSRHTASRSAARSMGS